jgi:Histidine kinase
MFAQSPLVRSAERPSQAGSAVNRLAQLLRADVGVLKGLTWRRIAYTVLVAAGLSLVAAVAIWMRARYGSKPQSIGIAQMFLHEGWGWLAGFRFVLPLLFSQMLALTVADNLQIYRIPRTMLLVVAFVLGTAVGSAVVMTSGNYADSPPAWGLVWGGLIALVYFKRRRDEELAAALHGTQMAHVELKKKALESHLQMIQAQVEPQFLFSTLRRVGDLYESDWSSADRMLDNLIAYLRAALPHMRTSTSTLGQEVRLATAYLEIERNRGRGELDFVFDIPEHLASATFPPMVLLPLIEALAVRTHNGSDYDGALRTRARANGVNLELTLAHTGDARAAPDEFTTICGRLTALYGKDGKLEVRPLKPRGSIAALHIPYVPN